MAAPAPRRTTVFDITDGEDRDAYEELINDPGHNRVVNETEYPMGGSGQVLRVVDYEEVKPKPNEFVYVPPIC